MGVQVAQVSCSECSVYSGDNFTLSICIGVGSKTAPRDRIQNHVPSSNHWLSLKRCTLEDRMSYDGPENGFSNTSEGKETSTVCQL